MTELVPRVPLPNFATMFAISGLAESRIFGGQKLRMIPFASQGLLLLWEGAILGRARRDRMSALVRTLLGAETIGVGLASLGMDYDTAFARASDEEWVLAYVEKVAPDGLRFFGGTPDSLLDLFATSFSPPEIDFRDLTRMRQLRRQSLSVENAFLQGSGWFVAGVSLGYTQPELARKLCSEPFGTRDAKWWTEFKNAGGLGPPDREQLAALGTQDPEEILVFGIVSAYADRHDPEIKILLGVDD